jgi:hypothetical protein
MSLAGELKRRLQMLFHRGRFQRELDEEMRLHCGAAARAADGSQSGPRAGPPGSAAALRQCYASPRREPEDVGLGVAGDPAAGCRIRNAVHAAHAGRDRDRTPVAGAGSGCSSAELPLRTFCDTVCLVSMQLANPASYSWIRLCVEARTSAPFRANLAELADVSDLGTDCKDLRMISH